jgi:hypothetical protein
MLVLFTEESRRLQPERVVAAAPVRRLRDPLLV